MNQRDDFRESLQRDNARQDRGEQAPAGLFGLLMYGGTLGLLLVIQDIIFVPVDVAWDREKNGFELIIFFTVVVHESLID